MQDEEGERERERGRGEAGGEKRELILPNATRSNRRDTTRPQSGEECTCITIVTIILYRRYGTVTRILIVWYKSRSSYVLFYLLYAIEAYNPTTVWHIPQNSSLESCYGNLFCLYCTCHYTAVPRDKHTSTCIQVHVFYSWPCSYVVSHRTTYYIV